MSVARLAVLGLALLTAGCASLSESECRSRDWRGIGRADAQKGLPASELGRHRKACADHSIVPDDKAYVAGHAEGLKAYCTPPSGYRAARRGELYREICPAGSDRFLEAFRRGREVSVMVQEVKDLQRRVDEIELRAMSFDGAPEDRTNLRFRAEELEQRLRSREWDVERLDRRYAEQYGVAPLTSADLRY